MRYFIRLSYDGTSFAGWQRQPNAPTIQEKIERALETIFRQPTPITGCGRTDSGVHARNYIAHFDGDANLPPHITNRLNGILPDAIVIHEIVPVDEEAHARFDATSRSYVYYIHFDKDPFRDKYSFRYHRGASFDIQPLNDLAQCIMTYKDFFPFSKTHTDVKTYKCDIKKMTWTKTDEGLQFNVTANRFLRGMIRLLVGCSLRYMEGKISKQEIIEALDKQERLGQAWSVPGRGLFLKDIVY